MRPRPTSCDAETVSVRYLIVDDSEQFLEAAAASLGRNGIEVVGTATNSASARERVEILRPDGVLVDVGLGEESGFDLVVELVDAFPYLESRIVLISTRAEDDYSDLVEASPAVGFISKSELSAKALQALVPADEY